MGILWAWLSSAGRCPYRGSGVFAVPGLLFLVSVLPAWARVVLSASVGSWGGHRHRWRPYCTWVLHTIVCCDVWTHHWFGLVWFHLVSLSIFRALNAGRHSGATFLVAFMKKGEKHMLR